MIKRNWITKSIHHSSYIFNNLLINVGQKLLVQSHSSPYIHSPWISIEIFQWFKSGVESWSTVRPTSWVVGAASSAQIRKSSGPRPLSWEQTSTDIPRVPFSQKD